MRVTRTAALLSLAVLCVTAPASTRSGSVAPRFALQPAQGEKVDYGAEFAGTPIVGTAVNYSWREHTLGQLPRSACAPFYASVDRHTYWFKEAANSQQEAERLFLSNVSTVLCANPEQSDDEYTAILHSMLRPVRDAINRHVHSAFWVKATCADLDDACFDASRLYDEFYEHEPTAYASTCKTKIGVAASMDSCLGAVLTHEKYNLAEGFYFLNMSYYMLERGSTFCSDPQLGSILATMKVELEAHLDYHASNHAFEELAHSHEEALCTMADEDETTYQTAYDAMVENIDRTAASVIDGSFTCKLGDAAFARMQWMKSNPPGVGDLISMIEGNTLIVIAAATEAASAVIAEGRACLDPQTGDEDAKRTARLQLLLEEVALPTAAYPSNNSQRMSPRTNFHAIPTVYHKLAPTCLAKDTHSALYSNNEQVTTVNYTAMCIGDTGDVYHECAESSVPNTVPIMDLVTSSDISRCSGDACKAAARAVVAYQSMLAPVTPMRLDALQMAQGIAPVAPILDQNTWTYQRSCDAVENVITRADVVMKALPGVVAGLREVAPQLEASCIAPPREWPQQSEAYLANPTAACAASRK